MTGYVPKVVKLLTRPVLKMEEGVTRYVKIESAMFIGKDIKSSRKKEDDDDKNKKEPATIVNVINLGKVGANGEWIGDGSQAQIVMNAVLKGHMADDYPDNGYVGKCFAITKQSRAAGKSYNPFHIEEIADPAEFKEEAATGDSSAPAAPAAQNHQRGASRGR
jgi:hypothetical protein